MQVAADYGKLYFAGPAADAEITASLFDKHTFRVARNSYHDAKAGIYHSMDVLGAEKIAFLALDHPFGYTGVAAMQSEVVKRGGQVVTTEYAPYGTTDFSSYLTRLNTEATTGRIDMLHIIWAGSFVEMLVDIANYNVGSNMNISGVAIDIFSMNLLEAALNPLGVTLVGSQGLCVYGYELPNNEVNDWMVQEHLNRNVTPNGQYGLTYRVPELFTASAFGSAQFLVNVTNTVADLQIDNMIHHLEGLNITTPKGPTYLRPTDHQGLAEMYIADVVNDTDPLSETYNLIIAKLNQSIPALEVAPPVATNYVPYPDITTVVETTVIDGTTIYSTIETTLTSIVRTPGFGMVLAMIAVVPVVIYKKKKK
jgi:branched-chain amino acid transport system substrate-binding protein